MDQNAKFKKSMFAIAKDVGLPAAFIEIRHEVTHGEMPSLVVLRDVARRSLTWLYDKYWSRLADDDQGLEKVEMTVEELKIFLRTALRTHFKARLALNAQPDEKTQQTLIKQGSKAYKEIVYACRNDRDKLKALSSVLIERKILVPSNKRCVQAAQSYQNTID